jgi:hypothetical protein
MMRRESTPEFEAWLRRAKEADIYEEALARGAQLRRAGREHVGPCPACGGKDRFSINQERGVFNCRGAVGGDVIAMVSHIEGLTFLQACEAINGEPIPGRESRPVSDAEREKIRRARAHADAERERRRVEQESDIRRNQKLAGEIWRAARPIDGTPAEAYLRARGIPKPDAGWPDVFRYHPAVGYPGRGRLPALIARVDNPAGVPVAIWRIYITADGKKASVPDAKRGLGAMEGGAVRIGGLDPHIGIAEGVESALGAWCLTGQKGPVWAATSGMGAFNPPAGIKRITIFPDGDKPMRKAPDGSHVIAEPAGRKAAEKLRIRMQEAGIPCLIAAEPGEGRDYLDLWNAET